MWGEEENAISTHCLKILTPSGEEVKILGNKRPDVNKEAAQKKIVICTDFTFWKIFIQVQIKMGE
jgi:hypothetical protein